MTAVNAFNLPTFTKRNSISLRTVYELAKQGKLKISKVGGKSLIFAEDEDEFRKAARSGALAKDARKPPKKRSAA